MTDVSKAEHAKLLVDDLDEAYEFYTGVMDLKEIDRRDGVVYLGCGYDENYDLAIEEGGTGIEHFSIRVEDSETLAEYESRMEENGVDVRREGADEPNVEESVRFELPSGHTMELVLVADNEYWHSADARVPNSGTVPKDLDHHNVYSSDIEADVEFLEENLDFKISDVVENEDGDTMLAFTRYGDFHHDLGLIRAMEPGVTLNHIGWQADNVDHMTRFIDNIGQAGVRLEIGISRHNIGNNVFAYFWEPGGNRFEISTEMATLNDNSPTDYHTITGFMGQEDLSAWGGIDIPESITDGS
ncbi:VOC family protein [Halobellus sp. GM3]|uniref:VOC family protein n=1 Tax=Halobellus sp. GM3 TaxID=3458410 RepID=UPI00403D6082